MYCTQIEFATPEYDQSIKLRTDILRIPLGLEFYAEDLAEEWQEFHIAAFDDRSQMLGILVFRVLDEQTIKMRQVAIAERVQRTGIGKKLVDFAENWARVKGYRKIELNARDHAIAFYESLNYKTMGKEFEEVGIKHMKMKKKL